MTTISSSSKFSDQLMGELRDMQARMQQNAQPKSLDSGETGNHKSFLSHLVEGVQEVNEMQTNADKMATDLASGKSQNIHETMLAATKAELGFNFMVQIRNKAIEAYQEIMRMQV
jgi:flagellar hook-basal body complex protein FliE